MYFWTWHRCSVHRKARVIPRAHGMGAMLGAAHGQAAHQLGPHGTCGAQCEPWCAARASSDSRPPGAWPRSHTNLDRPSMPPAGRGLCALGQGHAACQQTAAGCLQAWHCCGHMQACWCYQWRTQPSSPAAVQTSWVRGNAGIPYPNNPWPSHTRSLVR